MPTYSNGANPAVNTNHRKAMSSPGLRNLARLVVAAFVLGSGYPAFAQAPGDAKTDQQKAEANKTEAAHLADVRRQVQGPAGNPECVHLGENAISLMMRNDLDTAFRHMDLYDRFGCPGERIRTSFRCLLLAGIPGPKEKEAATLEQRVRDCWVNPETPPSVAAAAAPPAAPATTPPAASPPAPTPPANAGTAAH
jgi:hypothetical protein